MHNILGVLDSYTHDEELAMNTEHGVDGNSFMALEKYFVTSPTIDDINVMYPWLNMRPCLETMLNHR